MSRRRPADPLEVGRVPPGGRDTDLARERAALALALDRWPTLSGEQREAFGELGPDLYDDRHRAIHRAIMRAADADEVDVAAVGAVAPDLVPHLADLATLAATQLLESAGFDGHAGAVRQAAARRRFLVASERIAVATDPEALDEAVAAAGRALADVGAGGRRSAARAPVLVCAADVEPQVVEFLWSPYVPLGKLTLLEGDPEAGKTWVSLALAAAVTTGAGLPGPDGRPGPRRAPADVVLVTCEDGVADTIRPRLDLVGADPERVHVLEGIGRADGPRPWTLADVDVLGAVLERTRARLVVIDPVQGFLGDADMNKASEVRPLLSGIGRLAEKHGAAVVVVRHLGKAQMGKAAYRGLGSIDFTATARSVLMAGVVPGSGARVLVHTKASCAPKGQAQGYQLDEHGFGWSGVVEVDASDLLAPDATPEDRDALGEAAALLRELLADGPKPVAEVKAAADGAGIAWRTVERAKKRAGVVASRVPGAGGKVKGWTWALQVATPPGPYTPAAGGVAVWPGSEESEGLEPDRHTATCGSVRAGGLVEDPDEAPAWWDR